MTNSSLGNLNEQGCDGYKVKEECHSCYKVSSDYTAGNALP